MPKPVAPSPILQDIIALGVLRTDGDGKLTGGRFIDEGVLMRYTLHDIADLVGDGAPEDAAFASYAFAFGGADNDLTFTAVATGAEYNTVQVELVQGTGIDTPLSVDAAGSLEGGDLILTITLPSDGVGDPLAATALQVKTAWDLASASGYASVEFEGDGSGAVAAAAAHALEDGVDGTGFGFAGTGSRYIDFYAPGLYINKGTMLSPSWRQFGSAPEPLEVTASRDLTADDWGRVLWSASGSEIVLTARNTLPTPFNCAIAQQGTGKVTVAGGGGAVVNNKDSQLSTGAQYAVIGLMRSGPMFLVTGPTGA